MPWFALLRVLLRDGRVAETSSATPCFLLM
jgi:hypothetical protein